MTIPGPGTYALSADDPAAELPAETTVSEGECGDRIIPVTVPVAGPTCEKVFHLELCGCVAVGVTINITIPGGATHSSTTNHLGDATFELQDPFECDQWIGSAYSIPSAGLSGTISADPMILVSDTASSHWCMGGPIPCFEVPPNTLTGTWTNGPNATLSFTLTKTAGTPHTWKSGCTVGFSGTGSYTVEIWVNPDSSTACTQTLQGTTIVEVYSDTACSVPSSTQTGEISTFESTACPPYMYYFLFGVPWEFEVTP